MKNKHIYIFSFLIVLLSSSSSVFAQTETDFEVGEERTIKRVKLLTNDKTSAIFLDGKLIGCKKAKVKLDSKQPNLLVTTYKNGNLTIEKLEVATIPKEYIITPKPVSKPVKLPPAYFDSLYVQTNYTIPTDHFFGTNEKTNLYWRNPDKTVLTGSTTYFSQQISNYLTLYGLPSESTNYQQKKHPYQLILSVQDVLIDVQDNYGYVHLSVSVNVLNNKKQPIFTKKVFGVSAQPTTIFQYKQAVNKAYQTVLIDLMHDAQFISSIKRATKRQHKKTKPVLVAVSKKDTTSQQTAQLYASKTDTLKINTVKTEEIGFPTKYMGTVARLKTKKGLFVGFVIAEAGYLLTNKNFIGDEKEVYVKIKGQPTVKGKVIRKGVKTGVVLIQIKPHQGIKSLELAQQSPQKNDTIYSVMPARKWLYKKGLYVNEIALEGNFYHTAKLIAGKSTDGTAVLNSKGEVIGILDSKTSEKAHGNTVFIIPIKDALEDLNLKLE